MSTRELELLRLLPAGRTIAEIADLLTRIAIGVRH
jgi:DNA-binding NarL/FixJ family response regulator